MNKLAEILLPLPLSDFFTYSVPLILENKAAKGKRVLVQFGNKKIYTGIIWKIKDYENSDYKIKEIIDVLDDEPIINDFQAKLWEWISDYYCCTLGEVYKAAVPQILKLESDTFITINFEKAIGQVFSPEEQSFVEFITKHKVISVKSIQENYGITKTAVLIKSLIDKQIIIAEELVKEKYKDKFEKFYQLSEELNEEEKLSEALDSLKRTKAQYKLLLNIIELLQDKKEISHSELISKTKCNTNILKALIDKNIINVLQRKTSRIQTYNNEKQELKVLNEKQNRAYKNILKGFNDRDVVLLYGVTSSGKTEIYIKIIDEYLKKNQQVLYLLPEIALTTQIINRLRNIFGNKVIVYHSKFSDNERAELYYMIRNSDPVVILGVRSALFMPFKNLGLIIVDEEHENTYKQFDPAPRYHGRDTALLLASIYNAKVILGSATPSFESFYNAKIGKYVLVELNERFNEVEMPEIRIVEFKRKKEKKRRSIFTDALIEAIKNTLQNKEQVILFQNRRGYSPYIECNHCGYIYVCKNCDVTLTYHKTINRLVCHYCGYSITNTGKCINCGSTEIETKGFGTEKIEDEIPIFFPEAKLGRLDLDSTRSKKSYENIINSFELQQVDILIGTQMVSKGLHFDKVQLVGIMNADTMFNYPDFRAYERSFQLITQVSGRAGRKDKRGLVIIQTSNFRNPVLKKIIENDYIGFFNEQLNERKLFRYPPFFRLINISIKHKKREILEPASKLIYNELFKIFGNKISLPYDPLINKIQNLFIKQFLIKIERNKDAQEHKHQMINIFNRLKNSPPFNSLIITIDVDPI